MHAPLHCQAELDDGEVAVEKPEHYVAHVPVPSQKEVEMMLIDRQRKILLDKYTSSSLRNDDVQTKTLLGQAGK